jgi:hypothetical protein
MLSNFTVVLSFFEKYNLARLFGPARLLGSNLCHNLSLKILPRRQKNRRMESRNAQKNIKEWPEVTFLQQN